MHRLATFFIASICAIAAAAQDPTYDPGIAAASAEGERAIGAFLPADGFAVELIAAEPLLANPVAFYVDHQGRFYVAETFRHHKGVSDMRGHRSWLVDDLAARTVEDRLIAMKKNLGNDFQTYSVEHDRVRYLVDEDGDGKMDRAEVFADGFNDALAGIGAGLLVDRGEVYFTCIPELWKLRDADGDGVSDSREVLSSGYGVHIGFLGHDLHGLRKGPDGRLYFSIGDRGVHIKTFDGHVVDEPDTGAVFRCFPDGTGLEIVHTGLRNPQELAFDNHGNLFTGDNNSDGGDQARWVWIVDGGDSGWRIGYQWVTAPNSRGVWNAEKMWHPYHAGQPAHIVPPLDNIGAGPSGLTFYPGTGLPDRYADTFFMCDFRGAANISLIHAVRMAPKGAAFEVVSKEEFMKGMLATDADFGMNGGLYASDWTEGWDQPKKGRIYRIFAPGTEGDPSIAETKALLAEGMTARSVKALTSLLGHADQRVRFEAQWALADRGAEGRKALLRAAQNGSHPLARLHSVWGLWQRALAGEPAPELIALLEDDDREVRAQAAKVLGDVREAAAAAPLAAALNAQAPRLRFHFAVALGRLPRDPSGAARDALLTMLRTNADEDAYLRHAGVMGLLGQTTTDELSGLAADPSPAVRVAAVLALRRLDNPDVASFLQDADAFVRSEAARAIHDEGIGAAMAALAAMDPAAAGADNASFARRVLNARFRLGGSEYTQALAEYAASEAPDHLRAESLGHLALWTAPPALDRVTGAWRPMAAGDASAVRTAAAPVIARLTADESAAVAQAAAELAGAYSMTEAADALFAAVENAGRTGEVRAAALRALAALGDKRTRAAVAIGRESGASVLRAEALSALSTIDPPAAVKALAAAADAGPLEERQSALAALGAMEHRAAHAALAQWMDRLLQGEAEPAIQLDILEAAKAAGTGELADRVAAYGGAADPDDPLAPYRWALEGGDPGEGMKVFFDEAAVSCQRCHVVEGRGGGEVGPELTHIAAGKDRAYLLAAIADPNRDIAQGYENVVLNLTNGTTVLGRLLSETADAIELEVTLLEEDPFADPGDALPHSTVDVTAEGAVPGSPAPLPRVTVNKADIAQRTKGLSSMPQGLADLLTPRQLRDLVAYLAERT